jgi:3',5'-cyclic AMP phosphodiesterase CpdA
MFAGTSKKKRKVRIVAISDTHYDHYKIDISKWPSADIFIHAGDFTITSTRQEFADFRQFLSKLPYKHKIVIAGNHDFGLEASEELYQTIAERWSVPKSERVNPLLEIEKLKSVCTYLNHECVEV